MIRFDFNTIEGLYGRPYVSKASRLPVSRLLFNDFTSIQWGAIVSHQRVGKAYRLHSRPSWRGEGHLVSIFSYADENPIDLIDEQISDASEY